MGDVILDAFIDSLKLLAVVTVFAYIIALMEPKASEKIKLKGNFAPLIGASVSLLPQCGFSVVAADLYKKRHITLGTLIAVFIATSDEALPVFLSYPQKALHILPILAIKFALAIMFGYIIDAIFFKSKRAVKHHIQHCADEYRIRLMHCDSAELVNCDKNVSSCDCSDCNESECVKHQHFLNASNIDTNNKNTCREGILYQYNKTYEKRKKQRENINRFVIKPLLHSIEIFIYVLIVNIIFGVIFYYIGEEKIINFLLQNKYLTPIFSVIIGAIPNCVSSIVLSELYLFGGLGFGAAIGGLTMNAGVAFMILFKDVKHWKRNLGVLFLMFLISIFVAYIFSLIFSFAQLNI